MISNYIIPKLCCQDDLSPQGYLLVVNQVFCKKEPAAVGRSEYMFKAKTRFVKLVFTLIAYIYIVYAILLILGTKKRVHIVRVLLFG